MGHAGFLTGIGYLDGDANVKSQTRGLQGTNRKDPLPSHRGEFRVFPDPRGHLQSEARGQRPSLGGLRSLRSCRRQRRLVFRPQPYTAQVGYAYLNADIHERTTATGFKLDFRGPVISIHSATDSGARSSTFHAAASGEQRRCPRLAPNRPIDQAENSLYRGDIIGSRTIKAKRPIQIPAG